MSRESRIHVHAFARLHLGFLDLNGSLGRRFGSIGLSLEDISLELLAAPAPTTVATGPGASRAEALALTVFAAVGYRGGASLHILSGIPEHAGLGSGTQLSLAVGAACARIAGASLSIEETAALLDRGQRSGIGIGTFCQGGFVVDAGQGRIRRTPPLVSRMPVPESWRFVLVMDRSREGVHGKREAEAFAHLPLMPETQSAHLCRITMMCMLPALAEVDCPAFGAAVTEVQQITGEYFARWQGGRFTSPDVAAAVAYLEECGAAGSGQSSWGPTGFAIFPDSVAANRALESVRRRWHDNPRLDFVSCRAANQPAAIRTGSAAARHARG